MSSETKRRGYDPDDRRLFSDEAMSELRIVQEEVQWLLDRGYKPGPVIEFTGSHHQIVSRQRAAIQRALASSAQYDKRKASLIPCEAAKDGIIYIDGFNLIITLETALSGGLIILGKDGVLRDLAGIRGTYSLIRRTDEALELIGKCLLELSVPEAVFYLDKPVSNSGKLRNRILEYAEERNIPVRVELVPNADVMLAGRARIVTGDSVLLDRCTSWLNLSAKIVSDCIKDAWIVTFN